MLSGESLLCSCINWSWISTGEDQGPCSSFSKKATWEAAAANNSKDDEEEDNANDNDHHFHNPEGDMNESMFLDQVLPASAQRNLGVCRLYSIGTGLSRCVSRYLQIG